MEKINNELKFDEEKSNMVTRENSNERMPIESKFLNQRIEKYLNNLHKSLNLYDVC